MLPVLLDLRFLKLYTFGVFLVLAFFWGAFLLWKNFLLTSYKEDEIFDGLFFSLFGGFLISRILYVFFHFDKFGFSVTKFLLINGYPGLNLYGFLIGGFFTLYLYTVVKKMKFAEVVDYFVPAAFLALGFGKIGAFLSGAEVGAKTGFPIALRYIGVDGFRHLTPLYESLLFFAATFLSYKLLFSIRRDKYYKGFNFAFFIFYFAAVYALFDLLKVDRVMIWNISINLAFSVVLLLTYGLYFLYYFRSSIFGIFKNIKIPHGKKTHKGVHQKTAD